VDALERDSVKRIVLVRLRSSGERLVPPGDLAQKVDPTCGRSTMRSTTCWVRQAGKLFERGAIELAPLAYMRGRTLNHSFVILDEARTRP